MPTGKTLHAGLRGAHGHGMHSLSGELEICPGKHKQQMEQVVNRSSHKAGEGIQEEFRMWAKKASVQHHAEILLASVISMSMSMSVISLSMSMMAGGERSASQLAGSLHCWELHTYSDLQRIARQPGSIESSQGRGQALHWPQ